MTENATHFGFRQVARDAKAGLVDGVFDSVAPRYDVMNDLMSFGAHRCWKHFAVSQSGLRAADSVLDVAGGTGDLACRFAPLVGRRGRVVLADINAAMLAQGKRRLVDAGLVGNLAYVRCDAENLPFASDYFDCVSIAFGLRNVTDKPRALACMFRVLRPGGRLLVLEFSKPVVPLLGRLYDAYSFNLIPRLGRLVTGDEASYRYLVESIRRHPDQQTLADMMRRAGFETLRVHNLSGGIVALHIGYKYAPGPADRAAA